MNDIVSFATYETYIKLTEHTEHLENPVTLQIVICYMLIHHHQETTCLGMIGVMVRWPIRKRQRPASDVRWQIGIFIFSNR